MDYSDTDLKRDDGDGAHVPETTIETVNALPVSSPSSPLVQPWPQPG